MADDDSDSEDEYGKTVMAPSPFFSADGKLKSQAPAATPTKTPAPRARQSQPESEPPVEIRRPKAATQPRDRVEEEPRAQRIATRSHKRLIAPIIAGGVLILGVGIAAGIFIAGNGTQVVPAPAPRVAAPLPLPQPVAEVANPPHADPAAPQASAAAAAVPPTPTPTAIAPPVAVPPPSTVIPAAIPAPQPAAHLPPPVANVAPPKDDADKPKAKAHKQAMVTVMGADVPPPNHGKKSFLLVKTIAGVKVLVDNKQVGVTPLAGPLEVGPGARFVTLIAPDGRKKGYAVEIDSGDTYNLSESF